MTRRAGVLAAAIVAVLAAICAQAALGGSSGSADRPTDAVLLGPTIGESVPEYVATAAAEVAARAAQDPAESAYALVALTDYLTAEQLGAVVSGLQPVRVVIRVPLPRVQTAVVQFGAVAVPADVRSGMARAADDLAAAGGPAADEVAAAVVEAQVRRLRSDCACVYAVIVQATTATLAGLGNRPGIRAVQIAPRDRGLRRLAFAPLLPDQRDVVSAPPDDGAAALLDASG